MVILTDALSKKTDEGCIKVATNLVLRMKKKKPEITVVSYKCGAEKSDVHMNLNRLFLNPSLIKLIRKKNKPVLYIPFASNTKASVLRTFILSLFCPKGLRVMFALRHEMSGMTRWLLKRSRAQIIALSRESWEQYCGEGLPADYLQTGIDTRQFVPAETDRKTQLREKYGLPQEKPVILHVGHLSQGRNVEALLKLDDRYHAVLVISSVSQWDMELRKRLEERPNITIIDSYVEAIEEIYQLADVYLFPVQQKENCIDVPLSVLEAASCNVPVVATKYGELQAFAGEPGFTFVDDTETETLNWAIAQMLTIENCRSRNAILAYDWDRAIQKMLEQ